MKIDLEFKFTSTVQVFLNGELVDFCVKLDTDEGWVDILKVDRMNHRLEPTPADIERLYGTVTVKFKDQQAVEIDYTNHRGERFKRIVVPYRLKFGHTPDHPAPDQFFVDAYCLTRGAPRTFAMKDIHSWTPVVL